MRAAGAAIGAAGLLALAAPHAALAAQSPYAGVIALPGTIQAENYDEGGEGVAFHDTDATNAGGRYRSDGVDVEAAADTGGGYAVGTARAGEWLEYTVDVATAGTYDVGLRVASGSSGGKVHLELDGDDLGSAITIPATGGWEDWTTIWRNGVALPAGPSVLRLALDSTARAGSSIANVSSIIVRAADDSGVAPTPTPKPTVTPKPTATPKPSPIVDPDPTDVFPASEPAQTSSAVWPSKWSDGAAAPTPRFESAGITVGGKIYSFGGFADYDQHVRRDYVRYDPATNKWTKLGNLPAGMAETHLGTATDGRYVYFAGGLAGDVRQGKTPAQYVNDQVWRYDTATNTWLRIGTMPAKRGAGGLALIGDQLHYFGGVLADVNTDDTEHWIFDLSSKQWTNGAKFPEPKDHFSTIVLGGKIYTLCGEFGHHIQQAQKTSTYRYDPGSNSWTKLASAPVAKSHAEASTFISAGKIVIAGGQVANSASTNAVAAYDPAKNAWAKLSNLPANRQGTIVQRVGNKVIITTGGVSTRRPLANTWIGNL